MFHGARKLWTHLGRETLALVKQRQLGLAWRGLVGFATGMRPAIEKSHTGERLPGGEIVAECTYIIGWGVAKMHLAAIGTAPILYLWGILGQNGLRYYAT